MIVNPGKVHAVSMSRYKKMKNKHEIQIENKKITSEPSV